MSLLCVCVFFFFFLQGTPVNIIVGSHVWAEDPEVAWIDSEVKEINGREATLITSNGKTVSYRCLPLYRKHTFIFIIQFFSLDPTRFF